MKITKNYFMMMCVGLCTLFLTSCDSEDDTDPPATAPTVILQTGSSVETSGSSVEPNGEITLVVKALRGDVDLDSAKLEISDFGILATSNYEISGNDANTDVDADNPVELKGADKDGFVWNIVIDAPSNEGTYTYTFTVKDKDGLTDVLSVVVDVETMTALTEYTDKQFYNNVGLNDGGFDFSANTSKSTTGAPSEIDIKDNGNASGSVWKSTFSVANSATMVKSNVTVYSDATLESITEEHTNGTKISTSTAAAVDDVYIVKDAAGGYYIMKIDVVNSTSGDNLDSYEFSVKRTAILI